MKSLSLQARAAQSLVRVVPAVHRGLRRLLSTESAYTLPQYRLLAQLKEESGLGIRELAEREGVEPPTVSRTIEVLVQRGWVTREPGQDRRSVRLALTEAGTAVVDGARASLSIQVERALVGWDEAALASLCTTLESLSAWAPRLHTVGNPS